MSLTDALHEAHEAGCPAVKLAKMSAQGRTLTPDYDRALGFLPEELKKQLRERIHTKGLTSEQALQEAVDMMTAHQTASALR